MYFLLRVVLLLVVVDTAFTFNCFYFPREFLAVEKSITPDILSKHSCNFVNNQATDVARWNDFVKLQENFLLMQQCVKYDGRLDVDGDCVLKIRDFFRQLHNRPLCCNTDSTAQRSCIVEASDPCQRGENAGPDKNIVSHLCKTKHSTESGRIKLLNDKESDLLISMGIKDKFLHYYTTGCFDVPAKRRLGVLNANAMTTSFLEAALCNQAAGGGRGCCGTDHGQRCNLFPALLTGSFYAGVTPELLEQAAAANGGSLIRLPVEKSPAAVFAGDHRTTAASFLASPGLIILVVGCLALGLLVHAACLVAVCIWRRRAGSVGGDNDADDEAKVKLHVATTVTPVGSMTGSAYSAGSSGSGGAGGIEAAVAQQQHQLPPPPAYGSAAMSSGSSTSSAAAGAICQHPQQQQLHGYRRLQHPVPRGTAQGGCSGATSGYDSMSSDAAAAAAASAASDLSQTGSGAGLPILLPRTIAREVQLRDLIGQGRFGQVFRSVWRNDNVAVKIFSSRAESSWSTEGHMYELPGMRHDSILGFIAIDNIDKGLETQLWLITDYHANGSLQSYLTSTTVDQLTMARMLNSIASGLSHLHSEISGVKCKPAIAHRDVKSNNILVKADLTCCIADFGLAVACHHAGGWCATDVAAAMAATDPAAAAAATAVVGAGAGAGAATGSNTNNTNNTNTNRVGTRRYLSPECLDGSQPQWDFTALRKADVYAMGLVFWELAARCDDPERGVTAEPAYRQPYHRHVSANPSLEEMQRVVCEPIGVRPELPPAWRSHPVLGRLCRVVAECWYAAPAARLEAMSIKDQTARMLLAAARLAGEGQATMLPSDAVAREAGCGSRGGKADAATIVA